MEFKTSVPTQTIKKIKLGILSDDEKKHLSRNIRILFYSGYEFGKFKEKSLYDKNMGTIFEGNCLSCELTSKKCPGHPGLIKLPTTFINPLFIKKVIDLLYCLCYKCGSIRILRKYYPKILSVHKSNRLKLCKEYALKNNLCEKCGFKDNKTISYNEHMSFDIQYKLNKKDKLKELPLDIIKSKFDMLTREEINLCGFDFKHSHPSSMLLNYLICMPPVVRPVTRPEQGDGAKTESNFHKGLANILKSIDKIRNEQKKGKDAKHIKQLRAELGMIITGFLTPKASSKGEYTLKNMGVKTKKIESIIEKLSGKNGTLRQNINGRRVDFSGRSVIGGNSRIRLDIVEIPLDFAKRLTRLIRINKYNYEDAIKWIKNGPDKWPGATVLIKKNGRRKSLMVTDINNIIKKLELGDKIYRHLHNGDYVLFNRQPTLHKPSIMAHKVKINPYKKTLNLNTCVTTPYNADFDGDEMNLHGLDSDTSIGEARYLMDVSKNQIDSISSNIIISPIMDNILGGYIITKNHNMKLTKREFCNIIFAYDKINVKKIPSKKVYEAIDCINIILPDNLIFKYANFVITNGKWVEGILTKSILKKLLKTIVFNYGNDIGLEFSYAYQQITNKFLILYGITISINDCVIPENINKEIQKNNEILFKENTKLLQEFDEGKITIPATKTPYETYDAIINTKINECNRKIYDILKNYFDKNYNNFSEVIKSGAKGSRDNLIQIFGSVGQQKIEGQRPKREYNDRTFPFSPKYDENLALRGYVRNSFIEGLNILEYESHANAGREGVITTTLKTSVTGYSMRQVVKYQESIVSSHDYTVRNGDYIVSFSYGGDHFDTRMLFKNKLWLREKNKKWIIDNFSY
jgi:DNA-directed RNA polymerase beta' subunit